MADQTAAARANSLTRTGTVTVNVAEGVKLETLHAAIENIARLTGCLACGLVGIDVAIRGGDPDLSNIQKLSGVTGVSFS